MRQLVNSHKVPVLHNNCPPKHQETYILELAVQVSVDGIPVGNGVGPGAVAGCDLGLLGLARRARYCWVRNGKRSW